MVKLVQKLKSSTASRKITAKHNQPRTTKSFGAFFLDLAESKVRSDVGALEAVATQSQMLGELAVLYTAAKEAGDPIRECLLAYWHKTPEGAKWKKIRDAIPRGKKRSETQVPLANNMRSTENNLNTQLQRALDCFFAVKILRAQSRTVNIIQIGKNYACFVRAEKKLNEQTNETFNVGALQSVNKIAKNFTDTTPTSAVLAMCGKASAKGKKGAANKKKGGALEELSPALIGRTVRQLDAAMSPLAAAGKIQGVSKDTRNTIHAFWARIGSGMTDEEKTAAITAFNEIGRAHV